MTEELGHCKEVEITFKNSRLLITTILILICLTLRPPLWSSGQSSWLQIRRPGFDSQHYQKSGSGTGSTQPREYN
jgi:hypothetical protein